MLENEKTRKLILVNYLLSYLSNFAILPFFPEVAQ